MINKRFKKYVFLLLGSAIIPWIVTILVIVITGDRMSGLKYFAFPSILLVHLLFAFSQLNKKVLTKLGYGLIAATIATLLALIPIYFDLSLRIDDYGYWEAIIFFCLGTIGSWELLFQIDKKVRK